MSNTGPEHWVERQQWQEIGSLSVHEFRQLMRECLAEQNTKPEPEEKRKAVQLPENLDIRDYFAGKALQGSRARNSNYESWSDLAEEMYEIADAMLAARKKTNG